MSKCVQNDSGVLKEKYNLNYNQRRMLFYGLCIWVRLGLVYLSYKMYNTKWFLYVALIVSGIALLRNANRIDKDHCVWWSRRFHYMNLWIILCVSIIQLTTGDRKKIISILLLIDVLFGILYSFFNFNN